MDGCAGSGEAKRVRAERIRAFAARAPRRHPVPSLWRWKPVRWRGRSRSRDEGRRRLARARPSLRGALHAASAPARSRCTGLAALWRLNRLREGAELVVFTRPVATLDITAFPGLVFAGLAPCFLASARASRHGLASFRSLGCPPPTAVWQALAAMAGPRLGRRCCPLSATRSSPSVPGPGGYVSPHWPIKGYPPSPCPPCVRPAR